MTHISARIGGRAWAVLASAALLGTLSTTAAHADGPAIPPITYGYGLTEHAAPVAVDANTFTLDVDTDQVSNVDSPDGHKIRVRLPAGYAADPTRHYPVFYLLHDAGDGPENFGGILAQALTESQQAQQAADSMIIVMPDGGVRGWYHNWADQNTVVQDQNWENFHINQLMPFVDANFRTLTDRTDRAVGGMSMGGFGAFHYGQQHPELFGHVAAFSGGLDTYNPLGQAIVAAGEGQLIPGFPALSLGTHPVPVGSIFGAGPTATRDQAANSAWAQWNPSANMQKFDGTSTDIAVYTGAGGNFDPANPLNVFTDFQMWAERVVEDMSQNARGALDAAKIPYRYTDYGNGSQWGPDCVGQHAATKYQGSDRYWSCWPADLVRYLPGLAASFAGHNPAAGQVTGFQGRCLDVRGAGTQDGTAVQVYTCNGTGAQHWTFEPDGTVQALNRCLDVAGGQTGNGTAVQLYTCNGTGAQQWTARPDGTLVNPASGRCLSDTDWGGDGTQAVIWDCGGGTDQKWTLPASS